MTDLENSCPVCGKNTGNPIEREWYRDLVDAHVWFECSSCGGHHSISQKSLREMKAIKDPGKINTPKVVSQNARVAQLVELQFSTLKVAGSRPVSCSNHNKQKGNIMFDNKVRSPAKTSETEELHKRLVDQISMELAAHNTYLNMSVLFDYVGVFNLGDFAKKQAKEELEHANKLMDFLSDIGVVYQIGSLPTCEIDLLHEANPIKIVEILIGLGLSKERNLGNYIKDTYQAAKGLDAEIEQFLLWYVEEQVEEVAQFDDLMTQFSICGGNLLILDNSDFVKQLLED